MNKNIADMTLEEIKAEYEYPPLDQIHLCILKNYTIVKHRVLLNNEEMVLFFTYRCDDYIEFGEWCMEAANMGNRHISRDLLANVNVIERPELGYAREIQEDGPWKPLRNPNPNAAAAVPGVGAAHNSYVEAAWTVFEHAHNECVKSVIIIDAEVLPELPWPEGYTGANHPSMTTKKRYANE